MINTVPTLARPASEPTASLFVESPDELEMPWEAPPNSRVLIIRNHDRLWVPKGIHSLPPHCTLGMPYRIAAALALELNRVSLRDPDRQHTWHVVIYRMNKGGFAVMRVLRSANWVPEDEYAIPPDATEPMSGCEARVNVAAFNRRELQGSTSPEFWAICIKPLRKEEIITLNVSSDDIRVFRVNGQENLRIVARGFSSDRQVLKAIREALPLVTDQD